MKLTAHIFRDWRIKRLTKRLADKSGRNGAPIPSTAFAHDRAPTELIDDVNRRHWSIRRTILTRALAISIPVLVVFSVALSTAGITTCNEVESICTKTVWYPLSVVKRVETQTRSTDGVQIGHHQEWFWHGQTAQAGDFVDGEKHGLWREYWPNGTLRFRGAYDAGVRNGDEEWWYESGAAEWSAHWSKGTHVGEEIWWFPDHQVRSRIDHGGLTGTVPTAKIGDATHDVATPSARARRGT